MISTSPNGTTTTASDGSYTLNGLFASTYTIHASKAGYASAEVIVVTLTSWRDPHRCRLRHELDDAARPVRLAGPGDRRQHQINSAMDVLTASVINSIKVYTNITHTYRGDLVVTWFRPPAQRWSSQPYRLRHGQPDRLVPGRLTRPRTA
ncbi:MAG: carboxypeptidase regulatory-like domain-containing protein [bacterium]|nr:carboxypeptidase regulatory-like domain-containing protein [bacterium]